MIAISSHRPHEGNPEYAKNQTEAGKSWQQVFRQIFYFGHYEPDLAGPNVLFAKSDPWPSIRSMAELAAVQPFDNIAIINADILVTKELLDVDAYMKSMALPAATSYRYEFTDNLVDAVRHKEDRGMDIFIAMPYVWREVLRELPGDLRIGHNRWDSWLCGYFCAHLGYGFRQFTGKRCIFHPKHEGRIQPHLDTITTPSKYFTMAHYPSGMYPEP